MNKPTETEVKREPTPEEIKTIEDRMRETRLRALLRSALGNDPKNYPEEKDIINLMYFLALGYCSAILFEKDTKYSLAEIKDYNLGRMIEHVLTQLGLMKHNHETGDIV